jgi:hypothetical protein
MNERLLGSLIIVVFAAAIATPTAVTAEATTATSYCHKAIPGVPTQMTEAEAPFSGTGTDWSKVAVAITKGDWVGAKVAFEKASTYRARPYTGVHEPADTLFREGVYRDAYISYLQLAFCGDVSTLTFNDREASALYKTALQDAIAGNYPAAKAALQKDIAAHPSFLLGKNMLAQLYAITSERDGSRRGWQNVTLSGHVSSLGEPSRESLEAVEMLLYADRGIVADTASVSEIKTAAIAPHVASTPTGFARFTPRPSGTGTSISTVTAAAAGPQPFDVVTTWADPPPANQYGVPMRYYHARIYLHPTQSALIRARDFRIDGTVDGRSETYLGILRMAPMVPKLSFASGRAAATSANSVASTEDLGIMFNLQMQPGDTKTVVVTFAAPLTAAISDDQLHAIRWAPALSGK